MWIASLDGLTRDRFELACELRKPLFFILYLINLSNQRLSNFLKKLFFYPRINSPNSQSALN